LRTGCCEVHPWVHESYPCGICLVEGRRADEARREEEAHWHAQQEAYYAEIQLDKWVEDDLGPVAFLGAVG